MELALLGISLTANQDVTLKCREYECPILLAADKKQAEIKELKKKLMDSKVRSVNMANIRLIFAQNLTQPVLPSLRSLFSGSLLAAPAARLSPIALRFGGSRAAETMIKARDRHGG